MDLTYNIIRRLIYPNYDEDEELDIRALDDLDERYLIRTKDSNGYWLNYLKYPLRVEKLCSPKKGVIEVTVRKDYPRIDDTKYEDDDEFMKDVEAYFTELDFQHFRMKQYIDIAKLVGRDDDDEVDCCVGSTFVLDGPTYDNEEGYNSAWDEEKKTFFRRKLEAIFNKKGASCREIPNKEDDFGKTYHYEFSIYISYL